MNDERFRQFGLQDLIEPFGPNQSYDVHIWDPAKGQENIDRCERANVGITLAISPLLNLVRSFYLMMK